jgi:hypothetical protein
VGSEQNFGWALFRAGKVVVLNSDLTPFFAPFNRYNFNSTPRSKNGC